MVEFLGAAVLDGIDEEGNEAQFDDANVIYGRKVRMKGKKNYDVAAHLVLVDAALVANVVRNEVSVTTSPNRSTVLITGVGFEQSSSQFCSSPNICKVF